VKLLPDPLLFEWDKGNVDKNFRKHKVTNQEAEEIFSSEPVFLFEDEKHTLLSEERYMIWGETKKARKLAIIFTVRNNNVRIISVRDMNKKERRDYEQKTKTNT